MRIRRKLLRLSRSLGVLPSIGYATIYLALIPGFGFIYWMLPGNFHHATLQREATLGDQFAQIKSQLSTVIGTNFRSYPSPHAYSDGPEFTTWALRPTTITDLVITDRVRLRLEIDYFDAHGRYSRLSTWVSFPVEESPYGSNYHQVEEYQFLDFDLEAEALDIFPDEARQKQLMELLFPPEGGLRVPRPIMLTIRSYAFGTQGIGSEVEGNFWRMFYLSAITITTVGYGDIVPITTTSRVLVSIEAILGIVLIGLFLNSLAYERTEAEILAQKDIERANNEAMIRALEARERQQTKKEKHQDGA